MKLTTVSVDGTSRAARIEGEAILLLPFSDVASMLADPDWERHASEAVVQEIDKSKVTLGEFPAVCGSKIICLGLNYTSHIKESKRETPQYPTVFAKFPQTLTGSRKGIVLPKVSKEVDWEVELGVVIAKPGRNIAVTEAWKYIGGFTVVNDVSVRDWQHRSSQWLAGKNFEATTPVGPVIVTPDEVDGARDLGVFCEIDGVVMQQARTSQQLFSPAEVIAYISIFTTLFPGDLIAMGTPAGVAASREDRPFIEDGQTMVSRIDGIGACCNEFTLGPDELEVTKQQLS